MTSAAPERPPLRVEEALRLLPDLAILAPLRASVTSLSRAEVVSEPYVTIGKRYFHPAALRGRVAHAIRRVTEHVSALYEAALETLEAEHRGDVPGVVRSLLAAGEREERSGLHQEARAWYDRALRVAGELRDRRPEIDALLAIGRLDVICGQLDEAARWYQRAFTLAEAEQDGSRAALACRGLGGVALVQGRWHGAESWYTRGLGFVDPVSLLSAELELGQGEAASRRGDVETATRCLESARARFEQLGHLEGLVRVLQTIALLETARGRPDAAAAVHREALARLTSGGGNPALELAVRLDLCRLYLSCERLADAEAEGRRAEEVAIAHDLSRSLALLYVVLGQLKGRERDETGFVFFEKAIELSRGPTPSPRLEAEVYLAYGLFRRDLGDIEEARAYLERARDLVQGLGPDALLVRIEHELAELPME
jgi:tetratricopeptide (TPR) repeat protein